MHEILARHGLMAFEAGRKLDGVVGFLFRRERTIFPLAVAQRIRVFAAPAGDFSIAA
jgi:hypothetical protein